MRKRRGQEEEGEEEGVCTIIWLSNSLHGFSPGGSEVR